jgi:hypothetical protein
VSKQIIVTQRLVVEGKPLIVSLIQNPLIDDVLITEARLQATDIEEGNISNADHRVDRDVRDYLIRLGVER